MAGHEHGGPGAQDAGAPIPAVRAGRQRLSCGYERCGSRRLPAGWISCTSRSLRRCWPRRCGGCLPRKKKVFELGKEVKAIARERVGTVPAAKPIEPKSARKKPKHKKTIEEESECSTKGNYSRREFLVFGSVLGHACSAGSLVSAEGHYRSPERVSRSFIQAPKQVKQPQPAVPADSRRRRDCARSAHQAHGDASRHRLHHRTARRAIVPIESGKIDPNRMFSRFGAEANLKKLNPNWTPDQMQDGAGPARPAARAFAERPAAAGGELLVALHNNGEELFGEQRKRPSATCAP